MICGIALNHISMPTNKLKVIKTYLAIGNPRRDKKLARVENLSEIINKKLKEFYKPRAELSIN